MRELASREDFELLGFKNVPHFTIGNNMVLELSRGRFLTATCIGQGNESIWLGHKNKCGEVTDLICIHNRDYDGFIKWERLQELVGCFGGWA